MCFLCYRFNIRVNSVLPGFIVTPMTDKVPEKIIQGVTKLIPMQRLGKPEGLLCYIHITLDWVQSPCPAFCSSSVFC